MPQPPRSSSYRLRPLPALGPNAHKGTAGRVLCLAGSETMPGAAMLCVRAAQRGGAGLVALGCLDENPLRSLPIAAPEAILIDLQAYTGGWPDALAHFDPHAVLIGPGLGSTARTRALLEATLDAVEVPVLVDADGLNVCADDPELLQRARGALVITPHPGEARRMGCELSDEPELRREQALRLAQRVGGIVCLKGAQTVIADAEHAVQNETGNPGLATAGSGDVLAGLMAAYLARSSTLEASTWTPFAAARAAVHVHGSAGDFAALERGEAALIASDVIEAIGTAQVRFEAHDE